MYVFITICLLPTRQEYFKREDTAAYSTCKQAVVLVKAVGIQAFVRVGKLEVAKAGEGTASYSVAFGLLQRRDALQPVL
jgi:hypothetical protein